MECAVCGIKGAIKMDGNAINVIFDEEEQKKSRLTIEGKAIHFHEMMNIMNDFNRQFYDTLVDNISDGVYFVDFQKKICFWNKTAEQITGFSAEEVEGKLCSDHIMMHINAFLNGRKKR